VLGSVAFVLDDSDDDDDGEINTLLLLPLKIYLIVLKHIKSLILLKKLVFISNFNVFILMFFYSSLIALILYS